jgi:hypothetical protein
MDGSDHYRRAVELVAKAEEYLEQGEGRTLRPSGPPSPKSTPFSLWTVHQQPGADAGASSATKRQHRCCGP